MKRFMVKYKLFVILTSILIVLMFVAFSSEKKVYRDCQYEDINDVALYLKTYHELPSNYVTKTSRNYANSDNLICGGDNFYYKDKYNKEFNQFNLPYDVSLKEADEKREDYNFKNNRGKYRILYTANTDNVRVFTAEHPDDGSNEYREWHEISDFEMMPFHYIMLYIFLFYFVGYIVYLLFMAVLSKEKVITD